VHAWPTVKCVNEQPCVISNSGQTSGRHDRSSFQPSVPDERVRIFNNVRHIDWARQQSGNAVQELLDLSDLVRVR
jgi:hypothetical protein